MSASRKTRLSVLIVVLGCCLPVFLTAQFTVIGTGVNYTDIEFIIPDYDMSVVTHNGTAYTRIFSPEHGLLMQEGFPELPTYSFLLAIPGTGTVELETETVKEKSVHQEIVMFPSQGFDLEINEKQGFLKDKSFYESGSPYPDKQIEIGVPAIMRDMRLVAVTVTPFSYNPVKRELITADRLSLRIRYDETAAGINELTGGNENRKSRVFESLQRHSVLNYNQFSRNQYRNDYQRRSMIVVHHHTDIESYVHILNMYLNWKRDKGFEVSAINTADYPTPAAIQNYIQDAYNNWENRPEYIVIFGDKSGDYSVPIWTLPQEGLPGNADGDNPYGLLAGDDLLPDVLIGRIPVGSNTIELAAFWNKLRNYERVPYTNQTEWYEQQVLAGDTRPGVNNSGTTIFDTMKYVKGLMTSYNRDYDITEVYQPPFAGQMAAGINRGAAFFSFRGTEAIAGWFEPLDNHLHNGYMLPNIDIITCRSMDFEGGAFTDRLLKMGTPTLPKGVISALGMSSATDTAFNNNLTASLHRGLFRYDLSSMSEAMVYAKLELYRNFWNSHQWRAEHYFQMLNLLGDPSMNVWKGEPKEMNVTYPEELPGSANSIRITVTDDDEQPLKNAWVTIRKGRSLNDEDLFATGYTDEQGSVILYYDNGVTGEVSVTVTKVHKKPYLGSFRIGDTGGVAFRELITNDNFDAGETVNFILSVRNRLQAIAIGVSGRISTESEYIEITENEAFFGDIQPNANAQSNDNFVINIAPDIPARHRVDFKLTLTDNAMNSWISRFSIIANNGRLELVELIVEDNDDGVLDPLEEARLIFRLNNSGTIDLSDISAEISGGGHGLLVLNDTAFYGDINAGQTVSSRDEHIEVSATSTTIPGMIYDFDLYLSNEEGFSQTIPVKVPIGTVTVDDPLGPCAYGYWIYDCGDTDYYDAPVYNWIEIAPHLGGNGVNTGLMADYDDHQNSLTMDLPFTFTFYGEEYEELTICANGWISFGETNLATRQNWRLPGALGPDPIIAVFWDNLSLVNGWVFTYFDVEEHIFIIQWQQAANVYDDAEETFQIILYDPEYYITTTGDAPVKIQYQVFNNVNESGQEPGGPMPPFGEWGNYATIGIADHTGTRGLEYTFNNEYPTAARPLGNETAIYITTGSIIERPYMMIDTIRFNGDEESPHYGEEGSFTVRLVNYGGVVAENVTATLVSEDEYVEIVEDTAEFGDIDAEGAVTIINAFYIRVADNVPDKHELTFNLLIEADDNLNWNYRHRLYVRAPHLIVSKPLIYDPLPGGNNNGIIDPGEELVLYLPVKNEGSVDTPRLDIEISTESEIVTIREVVPAFYQTLRAGEVHYPAIHITVSEDAEPGTPVTISYRLQTGEYIFADQFIICIGDIFYVRLGEGDNVTPPTEASPINIYFRSLRSQFVYTAEELQAAGMQTATSILEFGFWIHTAPAHPLVDFTIRMRHTEASDVSEHIEGPYETVFRRQSYRPAVTDFGWDMLILDTPFEWNGVDNILVNTSFSPVASWSSTGQIRYYNVENGFRYTRADSPDQGGEATTTVSHYKPQALLLCAAEPTDGDTVVGNLAAIITDENQVMLTWDAPGLTEDLIGYSVYRNGSLITEEFVTDTEYLDSPLPAGTYYYWVMAYYEETGYSPSTNIVMVSFDDLSFDEDSPELYKTELLAAYPNPFNPQTVIEFTLKERDKVTLELFNILGQRVKVLTDDEYEAGRHRIVWEGTDDRNRRVSSGIYFYRMTATYYRKTGKVIMLK